MASNYSSGRYVAYDVGEDGPRVGWVDEDEYVRSDSGAWEFRIDGDEVYSKTGELVGLIDDDGIARRKDGQFLFRLEEED